MFPGDLQISYRNLNIQETQDQSIKQGYQKYFMIFECVSHWEHLRIFYNAGLDSM